MANSLFDQLKKSGLVDDNKAKKVKQEKHKQLKQQKGKKAKPLEESKRLALQAQAENAARDRELNRQRDAAAAREAFGAQIKQMVEMNRIDTGDGTVTYNFNDAGKVQRIYVTELHQKQLAGGRLAIVKLADGYHLVPAAVAARIAQRDASYLIVCNDTSQEMRDEADPYADYQIPDDLMW